MIALSSIRVIMLLCALAMLAGCSSAPVAGLPERQALQQPKEMTLQLEARWKNFSGSLLTVINADHGELDFFATTLLGQEVFYLHYDGEKPILLRRSDALPRSFRADYLLRDLMWAQWPAAELQPALGKAGIVLQASTTERRFLDQQGNTLLRIEYDDKGGSHISNATQGYVLDLSRIDENSADAAPAKNPELAP